MSQTKWLAAAALLLLFPVSAHADANTLVGNRASLEGAAHYEARLIGLASQNATQHADLIVIRATVGTMQVDQEQYVRSAGIGLTPANRTTSTQNLRQAVASGFDLHAKNRILILPANGQTGIHAELAKAQWQAALPGTSDYTPWASRSRPHINIDRTAAISHAQDAGVVTVEAPFRIVAWGADFTLTSPAGKKAVSTGSSGEMLAPGLEQHTEREAFLDVQAGNVTFPLAGQTEVYVANLALSVSAGAIILQNPAGSLPFGSAAVPAGAKELRLDAPFATQLAANGQSLAVAFTVPPSEAAVDGAVIRPPGGENLWILMVGIMVVAALPAGAVAVRQMRHRGRLRSLDRSMTSKHFEEGLAQAKVIRRRRPTNPDALVAESLGLIQTERFTEAIAVLEQPGWTTSLEPLRNMMRAAAQVGLGQRDRALECLASCLRQAPDLAFEAAASPLLAGLVREAQQRIRQPFGATGASPGHP
ncbi:MAG: hypothetical protein LC620_01715 [Halobacteriales archaeon]|nr:hypothetical protein [Halobacteriales archaeon]